MHSYKGYPIKGEFELSEDLFQRQTDVEWEERNAKALARILNTPLIKGK
jgi:hypothetical protein